MTAIKMRYYDELCLGLVFDDGSYAVHHGMHVWTIFDVNGKPVGGFNAFSDEAKDVRARQIADYCARHPNKIGRIEAA